MFKNVDLHGRRKQDILQFLQEYEQLQHDACNPNPKTIHTNTLQQVLNV